MFNSKFIFFNHIRESYFFEKRMSSILWVRECEVQVHAVLENIVWI